MDSQVNQLIDQDMLWQTLTKPAQRTIRLLLKNQPCVPIAPSGMGPERLADWYALQLIAEGIGGGDALRRIVICKEIEMWAKDRVECGDLRGPNCTSFAGEQREGLRWIRKFAKLYREKIEAGYEKWKSNI